MKWFWALIFITSFGSIALAAEPRQCVTVLRVNGYKNSIDRIDDIVRFCEKRKDAVLLKVDYSTKPTRSLVLSDSTYQQYLTGIKNTVVNLQKYSEATGACEHETQVEIDLPDLQQKFMSCDDDKRALLVTKLLALIRDLNAEPQ